MAKFCPKSLLLLLSILCFSRGLIDDHAITESCILQFQNKSGAATDADCGGQCYYSEIKRGCSSWGAAVRSSCQHACDGTRDLLPPRELFCVMSCNYALNQHFQHLRDAVGVPPAPALVADSLNATSLSLEWSGAGQANNDTLYGVQWRYEEITGSRWTYCCNHTMLPGSSRKIENLTPYTKYRFRVAALISNHSAAAQMVQFSEPSVVMNTQAEGLPESAPQMVRAVAVDASHVSVTWLPGAFPRGPVLSYVLYLNEVQSASNNHSAYSAVKDVAVVNGEPTSYLWQNVPSGHDYSISVASRNWAGEGPSAITFTSTPEEPDVSEDENAQVILCTKDVIYNLELDIIGEMTVVFNSSNQILGCAVHLRHGYIFFSDTSGTVSRLPLDLSVGPTVIADRTMLGFEPSSLSVDWLNDALYIVGEAGRAKWRIVKCSLDGQGLTVALAGFNSKPRHLQIDPYNGYMFWIMKSARNHDALYRLDLAEPSNGVRHETRPEMIMNNTNIGAFTIDYSGFRLLVADEKQNSIFAVSLDGKEISNIRQQTQQAEFNKVKSLVTISGLFFWTDGQKIMGEERNPEDQRYFHFILPHETQSDHFALLSLSHSAQLIPVPVNPPTSLQAILGHITAKLAWQAPHLVGGQGKGAWQDWSYEVQIKDEKDGSISTIKNITSTSLSISPIKSYTQYTLKVGAYTSAGRGPWSTEFRGKSFQAPRPGQKEATIVWGAEEGLIQTDTTGDNLETLVHADMLRDINSALYVTTVAWFEDILYLSTNSTKTMWFNSTSRAHGYVAGVDSAGSIAVDWLGRRLYWSNPKQSLIKRCSLTGEDQEPLPIFEIAKEIHVDSLNAYLYWSTSYSVESSRLNGQNKTVYYPAQLFSGKQVMGLTLDNERGIVFWIVRGNEGSVLYKAPMARDSQTSVQSTFIEPEKVTNLLNPVVQGPLCYFNDHLLWLQDGNNAVISDMNGQGAAVISDSGLSGLYVVAIIDPTAHMQPSSGKPINVIPDAVLQSSIRFVGSWNNFNITWDKVTNVNYGKVFYEVKIINGATRNESLIDTELLSIPFPEDIPSYSLLKVTVRAYTYWGSAIRGPPLLLHTPAAPPSVPRRARAYVSFQKPSPMSTNVSVRVTFKWSAPMHPNGLIEGYRIRICNGLDPDADEEDCESIILGPNDHQYEMNHLFTDSQYILQIWAKTEAGEGAGSEMVWLDTSRETPVPKLLLAKKGGIAVVDFDYDNNLRNIVHTMDSILALSYLASDNLMFWLSREGREIHSCSINCTSHIKVYQLNNPGYSLTTDWIARKLYWSEQLFTENQIWSLDLQYLRPKKIMSRPGSVSSLQVSPLTNTLYWVEDDGTNVQVFKSAIDSHTAEPFFSNKESCTCPRDYLVSRPLSFDAVNERLIWINDLNRDIWSVKLDGCQCDIVVNATNSKGFSTSVITSDYKNVYWLNGNESVSSATRGFENGTPFGVTANDIHVEEQKVSQVAAIGSYLQPFPDPECLTIGKEMIANLVPTMVQSTSSSMTLKMPKMKLSADENCAGISLPLPHYHIYFAYEPCLADEPAECDIKTLENCKYNDTYESEITIDNLEPFTCYTVITAVSNYYSEMLKEPPLFGKNHIFRTDEGAPSEVRDVQVQLLSPWSIRVSWLPPFEIRGSSVKYELLWSTEGIGLTTRQFGELPVSSSEQYGARLTAVIDKLAPNQVYYIKVRAYSKTNSLLKSESPPLEVKTLPEPMDIGLVQASAYSLNISWVATLPESVASYLKVSYTMEYAKLGNNLWQDINESSRGLFVAKSLNPKSTYQFRLKMSYIENGAPWIWPPDSRFTFETLGDRPGPPGSPQIQRLHSNFYQVNWETSKTNGADIESYILEGKEGSRNPVSQQQRSSREAPSDIEEDEGWTLLYNGTKNHWVIQELRPNSKYAFRAKARNLYGESDWSLSSEIFDSEKIRGDQTELADLFSFSLPLAIAFVLCVISLFAVFNCVCSKKLEKSPPSPIATIGRHIPADVELATLSESPRGRSGQPVMQHTNALYISSSSVNELHDPTEENLLSSADLEIAALPHIRRDQIKLTCFLGSGAFGEVFEGEAKNIPGGLEKVAVKTLKKGATEHEKQEFLKEAQLMSNFRHEHILQMLGVCFDKESNLIVMELMEGGDLLNFLRTSRPLARSGEMTLLDLVSMSVDVAQGCRYLEEMRYVHRDLACRNCLVSFSGPNRVVKIGDFGLARDVYKNDYYRKEGEGLLPVRWMSPESLMDRVFTTHSDVWAFGVILWEILTMGQQPYPARTNQEVFNFVRDGGRLNRPMNCPDEMNHLMLRCWHTNPKCRPTFKNCLEVLEELKVTVEANPAPVIMSDIYGLGADNAAFIADHDYTSATGDSYMQMLDYRKGQTAVAEGMINENFQQPSVVYLPPECMSSNVDSSDNNKYLRVVTPAHSAEFDPSTDMDGYETPRKLPSFMVRSRALSVGEQFQEENCVGRVLKKGASLDRFKKNQAMVPYTNVVSISQPLLSCSDRSEDQGIISDYSSSAETHQGDDNSNDGTDTEDIAAIV